MVGILTRQREAILDAVQIMYTDVARYPERGFHFPTGRTACTFVGYPDSLLDGLPATVMESFAGVACPFAADVIRYGDTVLDIGCGSGTDALIAARTAGATGRVIAFDLTTAMLDKLAVLGVSDWARMEVMQGDAESLPLPDASVDVVTSNGVLNLVSDKRRAISEIHRVLRDGGRVQIADIVLRKPVSEACKADPQLWVECVVGATLEDDYVDLFRDCGFKDVEVLNRFDYFAGSSSAETREIAAALGAQSLALRATK
jgi:SAM-dependent methyltransferase